MAEAPAPDAQTPRDGTDGPHHRAIFESAVDFAIIATDRQGRVTDWNSGAEGITGWTAAEMLGELVDRLFTPEDRTEGRPAIEMWRSLEDGRASDECWHLRADGSRFWADGRMMPLRGAAGEHLGFLKILREQTKQRETAQARRADAEFLRSVLASSNDCIKVLDLDATLTFMSEGGQRIMEVSDFNAIRGCPWPDFWHGEGHLEARAAVEAARAGRIGHFQGMADTMAGAPRCWDVQVTPILGADGRPERLLSVSRDVTATWQAEVRAAALLELGDRLRNLDDPGEMAFAAAEIMGRTLGVGRAGYGRVDAVAETIDVGRNWTAPGTASVAGTHQFREYGSYIEDLRRGEAVVVDDAGRDTRTAGSVAALAALGVRSFVNLPVLEHGAFVAVFLLTDAQPRAWRPEEVAFVREVADRTRAAVERRGAEDRLRALAASLEREVAQRTADRNRLWQLSTDVMLVAGLDGVMLAVNPAWTAVLGWSEAELLGRSIFGLVHPDDLGRTRNAIDGMAGGASVGHFENRYRHRDGSHRWIAWTGVPADGLVHAVGRDVTAEKEQAEALQAMEAALRQSQKMEAVGQLTGGLAHDFNNLLAGITGSLDLLRAGLAQGRLVGMQRHVAAAQDAAGRAAALTQRLLAFSRRQTLDPKPTDANRLVAGMEDMIRRAVGSSVTLETALARELWQTLCDPNQLENALLNLAINARDAMPDGGRLTVETANVALDMAPGQYVALCVSDTGSGMSPEVAARAFDPFFTTKPLGEGTGLGLSMIYGFARQSGGQVRLHSVVGTGTTMRIYLPRHEGEGSAEPAAAETHDPPPARTGGGDGEKGTVLVVDDEATIRMLIAEVLEELGYRTLEAADGAAGLRALADGGRVDLLVTDVGLPGGMDGRQLADAARVAQPGLKVLFITGYAEAVTGSGRLEPGMQVLAKPFAMGTLAERIREVIAAG